MTAACSAGLPTTPDLFRDVIGRFLSGVTVVTAAHGSEWFATTASAVTSLSADPPMILVCLNELSSTGRAVLDSAAFAINILAEHQSGLATRFASKALDKFADRSVAVPGELGQPLLTGALATLECRVINSVKGGTHTVLFGRVITAAANDGQPLAYFRGQFGRLTRSTGDEA